eukprot:g24838.t1
MLHLRNSDFEPVQDLLSQVPVSQLFIALFIVISNWAILAIFTAVVSENMITTVENRRMKLEKDESTYRTDRSLVNTCDYLGHPRFTTFLNDPDKEAELCDAAGISSQDLKDLLKLLSHKPVNNDRSYILEKDFLSGLKQQNDAANERSMMRLEKQIMALEDRLRHWMEEQVPWQNFVDTKRVSWPLCCAAVGGRGTMTACCSSFRIDLVP